MSQYYRSKMSKQWVGLHSDRGKQWRSVLVAVVLLTGCTSQTPTSSTVTIAPSPTASGVVASPTIAPSPVSAAKSQATKDLEIRLSKAFTDTTKVPLDSVDCPAQFEVKAGNRFTCQATSEGQSFSIAVALTNPDGQFQWNTKSVLVLSKLEQFIQSRIRAKGGPDVTANCGGKIRVAQPGDTFECKVTGAQTQSRSAQVKVKDEQGGVDISLR